MQNKVILSVSKDTNNPFFTGTNKQTGESFRMYRFLINGDNDAQAIEQYKADVANSPYPLHTCNKTGLIIHRSTKPLLGTNGAIYRDKNGKWWVDDAYIQEQLDIAKFYPGLADSIAKQVLRNAGSTRSVGQGSTDGGNNDGDNEDSQLDPFKQ